MNSMKQAMGRILILASVVAVTATVNERCAAQVAAQGIREILGLSDLR